MNTQYVDVLVPLAVAGGDDGGQICEVRASFGEPVSHTAKGYDPAIIPLLDVKLASAGKRALDAVRRLPLPGSSWWRRLRITRPRPKGSVLTPLDARQGRGLDTRNSSSAELGLALALCCLERGRGTRVFFATGTLDGATDGGISPNEAPVGPVDGLDQKLNAVADWIEKHRVGPWGGQVTFFVPETDLDGGLTIESFADEIREATLRAAAVDVRLSVMPLGSLAEGAAFLKAIKPVIDRREIVARAGAVASLALAIFSGFAATRLDLRPTDIDYFLGPLKTPQVMRASLGSDGKTRAFHPIPTCLSPTGLPLVVYDDYLSVRFETDETLWPAGLIKVMFILIGETSAPRYYTEYQIHDPNDVVSKVGRRVAFGASFAAEAPEEEMKVVVLARKVIGFDTRKLDDGLQYVRRTASEGAALNAQALWLAGRAPAFEEISFRSVDPTSEDGKECNG